jgi:peptidoglycan/xylan/chitin deacetylase (PgdA/CDA1 family)
MIEPVAAAPVTWPSGHVAAASFTFDVDAESAVLFESPESAGRPMVMTHQSYGPLVGVPRILEILDRRQVPATFFVPGFTAERYPSVVRDIVASGHEVAHHGYLHESLSGVDAETEAAYLDRGIEALAEVAGITPVGFRAPMWEPTWNTPRLLAERNFSYDSSLMDADVPYLLDVADHRPIVEIPIHWGLDDWEQYCFLPGITGSGLIESPRKVAEMWSLDLDAMRGAAGCFVLTNHPFLTGRPSRAVVLDALIGQALDYGDVWVTNLAGIADHVREQGGPARSVAAPVIP